MCDVYSFGVLLAFLFTGRHSPVVPPDVQPPWVGSMIRVCTATAPEARLPFSRLHDWLFTGGVDLATPSAVSSNTSGTITSGSRSPPKSSGSERGGPGGSLPKGRALPRGGPGRGRGRLRRSPGQSTGHLELEVPGPQALGLRLESEIGGRVAVAASTQPEGTEDCSLGPGQGAHPVNRGLTPAEAGSASEAPWLVPGGSVSGGGGTGTSSSGIGALFREYGEALALEEAARQRRQLSAERHPLVSASAALASSLLDRVVAPQALL